MDSGHELFGKYRLQQLIGRGAFATVFRAEYQGGLGFRKQVALKVMRRRLTGADDPVFIKFLNEARLGAAILHPNLVEFYECGRVGDRLYIAMELIPGPTLADVIQVAPDLGHLLDDDFVLALVHQTARGLAALHSTVVEGAHVWAIHGDLKPGNIMLSPAGVAKITDWGIGRHANEAGEASGADGPGGSPLYMSPEQARGKVLDQASDVFSFGVTILELINREPVFDSETIEGVVRRVCEVDATDALDEARSRFPRLTPVLQTCLSAEPADRYPDGAALVTALRSVEPPAFAEEIIGALACEVQRDVEYQREALRHSPIQQFWSRLTEGDGDSESVNIDTMGRAELQPADLAASPRPAGSRLPVSRRPRGSWLPWVVAGALLVVVVLLFGPQLLASHGCAITGS